MGDYFGEQDRQGPTLGIYIPEGGSGEKDNKEVKINKKMVDHDSAIKKTETCDKRPGVC